MLALKLVILHITSFVLASGEQPLWKNLLTHHMEWEGTLHHDGSLYASAVKVHSVGLDDSGVAYVTFSADNINMDMTVLSDDGELVVFKEDTKYNLSSPFIGHTNLEIRGHFVHDDLYYKFSGNVSSQEMKDFGTVTLRPKGSSRQPVVDSNSHLRYGLAVGIPVGLAVVLMVSAALILWWGIKKGYLRHVPWAYKNFTNPQRSRSDYEMRDADDESVKGSEQTAVHM